MAFNFENLNHEDIREIIKAEINYDILNNCVYYSKRFNENGTKYYTELLIKHASSGSEETLAADLKAYDCFKDKEERGSSIVKVPLNANVMLAEGEFNRFYIRAVCVKAVKENKKVVVYRARHSEKPRIESDVMIGKLMDPAQLLNDLRSNIGIDTVLGLPSGPNSGLSVKIE